MIVPSVSLVTRPMPEKHLDKCVGDD